jgi:hypothetical protein
MTEAQRIGQLFLLGLADDRLGPAERAAIRGEHVGSVWFTAQTSIGMSGVRAVADAVQGEVSPSSTAGVGFFVAANQEGGLIQALSGPGFSVIPSAVVQGQRSPGTLTADARAWGRELLVAGVNLDFAPVFDVVPPGTDATNQPIGVLGREYGHDPLTAGSHAAAFVAGMSEAGVATTAKHFPGLGRVVGNTDVAAGVVDTVTTATDPYLASFRAGISAGVPFVMVALATYTRIDPVHLAAFSPVVIGGMLRGDLGFRGVVMSDDLGAARPACSRVHARRGRPRRVEDRPGDGGDDRRPPGARGRRPDLRGPGRRRGAAHPRGKGRGGPAAVLQMSRGRGGRAQRFVPPVPETTRNPMLADPAERAHRACRERRQDVEALNAVGREASSTDSRRHWVDHHPAHRRR